MVPIRRESEMVGVVAFLIIVSISFVSFLVYKDKDENDLIGKGVFKYGRNARMVTLLSVPLWIIFSLIIFCESTYGCKCA
jgi:hypothetical protein